MNGNLYASAQRPAQGAQDGISVEVFERASVETSSDALLRSIDTYLRACGVTDDAVRARLTERLLSRPPDPAPRDEPEQAGTACPCGPPDFRALQAGIDAALAEELGLEESDPDQPMQLARALIGAAARAGSPIMSQPEAADLRSVPPPRPTRMPAQDLSAWTPARALASLLTRMRPPATA